MRYTLLLLLAATPLFGQGKRIFMITDAEGVAGVCRQDQTDPKDTEMRQLLTGEINAAVQGFFEGGASEVVVWDGHDGSQTLSALTIHPAAKLVIGAVGTNMLMDRGFAGLAFVGQHARANSPRGVMAHSFSSLGIQNMLVNGRPVGEIETNSAIAGAFKVPAIFLSGDRAAVEQFKAIVPNGETAEVKEGLSNYSCINLSAVAARKLIQERATAAMRKIDSIKPFTFEGPVTLQIESTSRSALPIGAADRPGAEVLDARTIRYKGRSFLEAWKMSGR
jgi:D-amino peptidase